MAGCKNYDLAEMQAQENQPGLAGKVATHHMKLHYLAASFTQPTLVEFGVAAGRSTCVFTHAAEQTGGHLYSVDIGDFSDVVTSDAWTFIQQSDQNKDAILAAAPAIASGIDLLHIDSKHARSHVEALHMGNAEEAMKDFEVALEANPWNKVEILNFTGTIKFR
ncbi:MAG: class I SAM-dependent methyltransferase, partial [Chloroflexota bacterium]